MGATTDLFHHENGSIVKKYMKKMQYNTSTQFHKSSAARTGALKMLNVKMTDVKMQDMKMQDMKLQDMKMQE